MTQMQRRLGLLDSVFIGLGSILGAGVFVVTGLALEVAGPAMLVGFLLAGMGALMNALSMAQLARVYPLSGGAYVYAGKILNPWAGFAAGWMFLVSKLAAGAVVARSFALYLQNLLPGVSALAAALGLIILLTLLNLWGIKKASWFNLLVVSVTLTVLDLVVVTGIGRIEREYFTPFAPQGLGGILQAGALLFFAYTGYARIATLGEEVVNPQGNHPPGHHPGSGRGRSSLLAYLYCPGGNSASAPGGGRAVALGPGLALAKLFGFPGCHHGHDQRAVGADYGHQPDVLCLSSGRGSAWFSRFPGGHRGSPDGGGGDRAGNRRPDGCGPLDGGGIHGLLRHPPLLYSSQPLGPGAAPARKALPPGGELAGSGYLLDPSHLFGPRDYYDGPGGVGHGVRLQVHQTKGVA